nr:hypothetical protein [Tanacetum cinerariifolium]
MNLPSVLVLTYNVSPGREECSSCGALYTTNYCCSEGNIWDKIICDLDKTPDLSKGSPQNCPKCGHPVDGHYYQGCALLRKKFKEDLFISYVENGIIQDSSEPSNDNTNIVNAFREPFVIKQDPGENSSQSHPQINHHCCYGCGNSLDDIFCHKCTCKWCGNGAHYCYNCPPKVPIVPNPEPFNNQTIKELPPTVPSFDPTCYSEDGNSFTYDSKSNLVHDSLNEEEKQIKEEHAAKTQYWKILACYDDDDDYAIVITTKEPDNSLKSSVENLVPKPSESEGEYDNDQSLSDEDISKKIYSNPLFDEEIISMKIDPHHFNAESNLIESLRNHDSLIISSSLKIDSLFDEFAGELTLLKSIPSGINDFDPKEETRFIKRLLYDNSSPQIDLSFTLDDPMPSGIEEDDHDSKRDILILEELLRNDSFSLPENKSFHLDIPSSSRPPTKPPDGNSGVSYG